MQNGRPLLVRRKTELALPQLTAAQARIAALQAQLPLPWSEHTTYWLSLLQQFR